MVRTSPGRRPLRFEALENRTLMAGNVVAVLTEGTLTILGDEAANGVRLVYDVDTGKHSVVGTDWGGFPTAINGAAEPVEFTGVENVDLRLGAGDDRLDFGAADEFYTRIEKKLTIDLGDGNDTCILGRSGPATGPVGEAAHHLYVKKAVFVDLGQGDDTLEVANLKTRKSLTVRGRAGNDTVTFATEFTPTGATEPSLFPVIVLGHLNFHLGEGDDELAVLHALVGQHLQAIDPSGASVVSIIDVRINEKLRVVTGNQDDAVTVEMVIADDLQLHTNSGKDDVFINQCRFKRMNVHTGSEADDLTLRNSRTTYVTYLDGGDGGADFSQRNNILRGLFKRRLT